MGLGMVGAVGVMVCACFSRSLIADIAFPTSSSAANTVSKAGFEVMNQ